MIALLIVAALAQVPAGPAEEDSPKLNLLSVEVDSWTSSSFSLFRGSTALTYERVITSHVSISLGLVGESHELFGGDIRAGFGKLWRYAGSIRTVGRWYPLGDAPSGLWLGPMGAVGGANQASDCGDVTCGYYVTLFAAGALVGFSGTLPFGVVLQVSGGARADWATSGYTMDGAPPSEGVKFLAVSPVACLGVGLAF